MVDCEYFTTNVIHLDNALEKDFILMDSFVIYMCPRGKAKFNYGQDKFVEITTGETMLVPAQIKNLIIEPLEDTVLLEVYIRGQG